MSDTRLELFDAHRAVVTGLVLPAVPPTRISISGHVYKIVAPSVALPPIANVAKMILNWVGPGARTAANILFAKLVGGTGSTSDPVTLQAIANNMMGSISFGPWAASVHSTWTLQSVTARDAGGTTANASSTVAAIPGTATGGCNPPGTSVCISWKIADVYRGGKPRTYLPGIPTVAVTTAGESTLTSSYATALDSQATQSMNHFNGLAVLGGTAQLGTVSYFHGHTVRPTPLFRSFFDVHVHERIDSQRRRNGRESTFPVTP